MDVAVPQTKSAGTSTPPSGIWWHEVIGDDGKPRPQFADVLANLNELPPSDRRTLSERMEAVLREMGVTFDLLRNDPWGREPWSCDLLPHIFASEDWALIVRGFQQRLQAFELFLQDIYGKKEILRAGVVPLQAVLASPHYELPAVGLPRPRDVFLHLSGLCICRSATGQWQVKHHHFSHATGLSYMLQNRRALARVVPEIFQDAAVQPLAEMPLLVMERLRETASEFGAEPTVVLLSAGTESALSSDQSFLARRMGVPVVTGGDLLVLDDCVYLKTVRGLDRVEVIYNRIADSWLDPLVFKPNSIIGVPGLIHCLRRGTVAVVNAVGSQLADDRSLLAFAPQIIRFYLAQSPILPSVPTYWLGDLDQRELVLENLDRYRIRPIYRENTTGSWERPLPSDEESLRAEIRKRASLFVAQPHHEGATTICFEEGRRVEHPQDHIVFAARVGDKVEVFPGALTRVYSQANSRGEFGVGWTSKDSWVLGDEVTSRLVPQFERHRLPELRLPARLVTSRVAEAFYWMGRYLERAYHQAYLISVVETLESEELNTAERRHYQPMWNRLLPPLEKSAGTNRRSMTTRRDRYRLVLAPERGSVVSTFLRGITNAESVQDSLSPEAWATMLHLRSRFERTKFKADLADNEAAPVTRRLADLATQLVPQFFAVCANSMLADDAWRFCQIGQMLERAILTANSVTAIQERLQQADSEDGYQTTEIELSAFLRLLGCRDAYRRIFQMRAEPIAVLELLWQHPEVPRSVFHCVTQCTRLLRESIDPDANSTAPQAMDDLLSTLRRIDWSAFIHPAEDEDRIATFSLAPPVQRRHLAPLLERLLVQTLDIHTHIADAFLNHQARIAEVSQPMLDL
jgi:uncharacterized circularly permuted ATP-grasp superfamily protein/uncharacterized alpha-E superfamily protein